MAFKPYVRLLVCGGRDYQDEKHFRAWMTMLRLKYVVACIIEGGARGADAHARAYAIRAGINYEEYKADWNGLGRAAGPIRNTQMLSIGKPDLVLAFSGGRDTVDMVAKAKAAHVKTIEVPNNYEYGSVGL